MPKLSAGQAAYLLQEARKEAKKTNTRFGQCIINRLPMDVYISITGTNNDFFYWEDEDKVLDTFLNTCLTAE